MLSYAIRRLFGAIPTLLLVVTIAFVMVRATPGGPFSSERRLPPEIEANLRAKYHLDEPIVVQYLNYMGQVLQGDFGPSFKYKDFTVNELIWNGFKVSVVVGSAALVLALLIGTTIGTLAALRQNSAFDYAVMATAMTGITIPNFVMAPLLTLILGVHLGLLPVGGWGTPKQAILPIVTLALPQIAYVARMTRASMIEVLRSNFVRTARAKGLPDRIAVTRHALRAGFMPIVSYLGPMAAYLITGSVVIEVIFGIPGIGRYFIQGALNRDYTLVLGVVIFYGALIIIFNLVVDLLYGLLDPKVRYD